jgi:hypothetical protein
MLLAILAAATVAGAAAPPTAAPAAAPAAAPTATASKAAEQGDEMVCKREMVTGSNFPQKVCRRKADADQKRVDDQDRLRQSQRWTGGFER